MAFKMKGHTLPGINQRSEGKNLSDGRAKSSAFQKDTDPVTQGGVTPTVTVSGGDKTERHADKFNRVKKESTKGNNKTRTAKFAAEYGGTWAKQGNVYRNQDGQSVKEAAIAQGQKKSQEKRDYVAKNTTKKPGAPAIWPFGKKTPGGAKLVKVKKTKTTKPSQDLEGDTMQTYLDKTKGKRKRRKAVKNITKKVKNIFKKK